MTVVDPSSGVPTHARFGLPRLDGSRFLRVATLWQLLAAVLSAVGIWVTYSQSSKMRFLVVVVLRALLFAAVPLRVLAAWWLHGQRHRGRALALALDYLSALGCAFALAHQLRVFSGFDGFAGQFRQDYKPAALTAIALLVWRLGTTQIRDQRWRLQLGQVAMFVTPAAFAWFLVAIGTPQAIAHALVRLGRPMSLTTLIIGVAATVSTRALLRERTARAVMSTRKQGEALEGWLFLSPNLIGFSAFFIGPLIFSLVISFFNWNLGKKSFVGLSNYASLFALRFTSGVSGAPKASYAKLITVNWFRPIGSFEVWATDVRFWTSLRNIAFFVLIALPLAILPSLFIARLLTQKLPGMKAFRAIYFVPSVAGVVSISLIWKLLLNSSVGYLNYALAKLSQWFDWLPFVERRERVELVWLASSWTIVPLAIVFAWMTFGYNTVLFTAGMQSVPHELHEAASLDGANGWQQFRQVTIPLLRPTTFYVLITTTVLCLQMFDIIWVLTNPPGGPADATLTPVLYTYLQGFQLDRQGYAAAVAWVLALFLILLAVVQFRRQRKYAL